ncbi:MAG: hypothetical protein ABI910_04595 [Gemmatimonadota bacterium]
MPAGLRMARIPLTGKRGARYLYPRVSMTPHDVGSRSAFAVGIVGVVYAAVVALGMSTYGLSTPIGDPILALMEVLTIASALPLLVMMAALHVVAPEDRKLAGVLALASTTMFAATTCVVHFVELTAGRQQGVRGLIWPSTTYAAELMAWSVFLGLALLLGARVLSETHEGRIARRSMQLAGTLCLLGTVGPLVGQMRLQLIGVAGYGVVLPVAAFAMAGWFRASRHALER